MDEPRASSAATTPIGTTNVPEYTVSEVSGAVKRTLETTFGRIRVRGELTEMKRYPSGHIYLSLKDESAKISGIVWKSAVSRLGMVPENGVEVIATGRISSYPERSSYQLIIERMEYAGAGALLARIEMLRQRLGAEGLFDAARKKPFPVIPLVIGVVSSERGAVIQDIITTIARRFPRQILLWPVPVQGEGAAERIAAAIAGFDALPVGGPVPRPDVLIVARGGGSLEDLWAFNEEAVVRAAADSAIPLISAVGHETDTTLIDFAADVRAPTPTAAAEMAVPVLADLRYQTTDLDRRLLGGLNRGMETARRDLRAAVRGLRDPRELLQAKAQRLDDLSAQIDKCLIATVDNRRRDLREASLHLYPALRSLVTERRGELKRVGGRLRPALVADRLKPARRDLTLLGRQLTREMEAQLRREKDRLVGAARLLESFSYHDVLKRGFAVVRDAETGSPLPTATSTAPGQGITLQFGDGRVAAHVDGGDGTAETAAKKRSRGPGNQGSLF